MAFVKPTAAIQKMLTPESSDYWVLTDCLQANLSHAAVERLSGAI